MQHRHEPKRRRPRQDTNAAADEKDCDDNNTNNENNRRCGNRNGDVSRTIPNTQAEHTPPEATANTTTSNMIDGEGADIEHNRDATNNKNDGDNQRARDLISAETPAGKHEMLACLYK